MVALKLTRKDGSSPWEIRKQEKKSKRSIRGLEKFTQVVGGMVMIAEIFKNQGYDLYSYETKKGVTVHKMIDFLITYLGYPESGAKKKKYIDPERQQKEKVLKSLPGNFAIAHNRYSTTGGTTLRNIQPFYADTNTGGIGLAHNGNLTNAITLRNK